MSISYAIISVAMKVLDNPKVTLTLNKFCILLSMVREVTTPSLTDWVWVL